MGARAMASGRKPSILSIKTRLASGRGVGVGLLVGVGVWVAVGVKLAVGLGVKLAEGVGLALGVGPGNKLQPARKKIVRKSRNAKEKVLDIFLFHPTL